MSLLRCGAKSVFVFSSSLSGEVGSKVKKISGMFLGIAEVSRMTPDLRDRKFTSWVFRVSRKADHFQSREKVNRGL